MKPLRIRQALYNVREFFYQLLRVDALRWCVAALRYFVLAVVLRRMKSISPETGDIGRNTVLHNKQRIWGTLAVTRARLLLNPLSAIQFTRSEPLLCIGPRSEGELLYARALGFKNVHGLDLTSYSPWIDVGDMHAMPYKDNAYRALVIGWVFAYSDNRKKAAAEAVRITKNGGIIAVGVEYRKESAEELSKNLGYLVPDEIRMTSVKEILELFGNHVDHVYFAQDHPKEEVGKCELLVIFSIKK